LGLTLRDLDQGAKPPLFFDRNKAEAGRPKDISFEVARGAIAAAVSAMIGWGESRKESGAFVAEQVGRAGIKAPKDKLILARQVLRWRDEMGSTAPDLAFSTYKDTLAKYAAVPAEVAVDPARRRDVVEGAILGVRAMGF
jgi:hypothetical protein